jgi:hypothetical protein
LLWQRREVLNGGINRKPFAYTVAEFRPYRGPNSRIKLFFFGPRPNAFARPGVFNLRSFTLAIVHDVHKADAI